MRSLGERLAFEEARDMRKARLLMRENLVIRLHSQGASAGEIASRLCSSKSAAHHVLRRLGLKANVGEEI